MAELLRGRRIHGGRARAQLLVSGEALSFFGGVDPDTGIVTERGHPLEGRSVAGKVLAFPHGKGSTVGSYSIYRLARQGRGPAAIVNQVCETIVAVGAIIADIPCVDHIDLLRLEDGALAEVDADRGTVEVLDR